MLSVEDGPVHLSWISLGMKGRFTFCMEKGIEEPEVVVIILQVAGRVLALYWLTLIPSLVSHIVPHAHL